MKMLENYDLGKILELIAKGDPALLLAEKNLVEAMNELCKNGLVDIKEGKFILTPQGKNLLEKGGNEMLKLEKVENDLVEFSENKQKIGYILFIISLIVCLLSIFILFFIHHIF